MISYIQDGIFLSLVAGDGGPLILHQGRRYKSGIAQAEWDRLLASNFCRTGFDCSRCQEPVLNIGDRRQACRCSCVIHAPGYEFRSAKQWRKWQEDFDRELLDPAPGNYWIAPNRNTDGGPASTQKIMSPAAKAWFKRKFGLPAGLDLSDDGHSLKLPGVAGVLSVNKGGNISMVYDDWDISDGRELGELAMRLNAARESEPSIVVVLGDDPDYVWPPLIRKRSIRSLPFSCSRCGKRVKRAPLGLGEVLVCLCMQVGFGPRAKKRPPRNRPEWDTLRTESKAEETRVKAQVEGSRN